MQPEPETTAEIVPLNPIRVETALSRYPVHRLAKHGDIVIDIRDLSEDGETLIRWEVSHNSKYGQPGPLAYKLDTLIINRRIEEAPRPIPRIIRLGSLKEICRELELAETGGNTNQIKKALYQNAFAAITAKTRYRQTNGSERTIEFGDTRYGVVFTGEKLPDGRIADAVYIILHDFYREILDNAMTRPLDYGYLRDLTPAPQRFYEILSYQLYAALKHDRARAKLVYSEFCTHAPQTRYMEFDRVKKQMHKIHSVHRKSGYIAKIDYEQTTDGEGKPDWLMLYMPGPKARAEYRAFTRRGVAATPDIDPSPLRPILAAPEPVQLDLALPKKRKSRSKPTPQLEPSPLVDKLVQRGITEAIAADLVQQYPERIEAQLEILDWLQKKKPGKITEPGGWLVSAIKTGHATPKGFTSAAELQKQREAKQATEQQAAKAIRLKREADAREEAERQAVEAYIKQLAPAKRTKLEAEALAAADPESRESYDNPAMTKFRETFLLGFLREHVRHLLRSNQPAEA